METLKKFFVFLGPITFVLCVTLMFLGINRASQQNFSQAYKFMRYALIVAFVRMSYLSFLVGHL
jgi:hypothetical protein